MIKDVSFLKRHEGQPADGNPDASEAGGDLSVLALTRR